jgi:hypothetical protein
MLFDQVTEPQMQAARILTGTTMVAFLAAPILKGYARIFRLVVAGLYIAAVMAFVLYSLW